MGFAAECYVTRKRQVSSPGRAAGAALGRPDRVTGFLATSRRTGNNRSTLVPTFLVGAHGAPSSVDFCEVSTALSNFEEVSNFVFCLFRQVTACTCSRTGISRIHEDKPASEGVEGISRFHEDKPSRSRGAQQDTVHHAMKPHPLVPSSSYSAGTTFGGLEPFLKHNQQQLAGRAEEGCRRFPGQPYACFFSFANPEKTTWFFVAKIMFGSDIDGVGTMATGWCVGAGDEIQSSMINSALSDRHVPRCGRLCGP